jgi:ankyrin repeat protein
LHIVRQLLEHGADPNMPEDSAPTGAALFHACSANHLEIARLLLEHGADPNAGTDSSGCCLTIAGVCQGVKAKPLQRLLRQHGACTPPYAMSTRELREAIRERHEVIHHEEFLDTVMGKRDARLLDEYLDSDPTVPKQIASSGYPGSPALVQKLLGRGLDPDNPDWLGRTFLHSCAAKGDRSIAALFLKAGADINARDLEFKGTPLAAAVRAWCGEKNPKLMERRRKMLEFLLERGAATNLPGDEPWTTPLAWARKGGRSEIVALLLARNASVQ